MTPADRFLQARWDRMDSAAAQAITQWRYAPPYQMYDNKDPVEKYLRPRHDYHVLRAGNEVLGFVCSGDDCRVPGGRYDEGPLDFGLGMSPLYTGRGLGRIFLARVMVHLYAKAPGRKLRLTVAAFNERALRVYTSAGFSSVADFTREDGVAFRVMESPAQSVSDTME